MAHKCNPEVSTIFSVYPEIIDDDLKKKAEKAIEKRNKNKSKTKKKEIVEKDCEEDEEKKLKLPRFFEITMTFDKSGFLKGYDADGEYDVCTLFDGCAEIIEGSIWKCLICKPVCRFHVHAHPRLGMYPVEMMGMVKKDEVKGSLSSVSMKDKKTVEHAHDNHFEDIIKDLEAQIESLKVDNHEYRKKCNALKDANHTLEEEKESLKKINKDLQKTNDSLSTQVNVLNFKNNGSMEIGVEGIIEKNRQLEEENQELRDENSRLIEELKSISVKVSEEGHQPVKEMIFLTGPSGLHSASFSAMRYKVRFSPGKKSLLLSEDENGEIPCESHDISIPGLERFTQFKGVKLLGCEKTIRGLVVSLA